MVVQILGALDILAGISFLLFYFNILAGIALFFGYFLIVKGIIFLLTADFASSIDVIVGILVVVFFYVNLPNFLLLIFAAWVIQKGLFSFI